MSEEQVEEQVNPAPKAGIVFGKTDEFYTGKVLQTRAGKALVITGFYKPWGSSVIYVIYVFLHNDYGVAPFSMPIDAFRVATLPDPIEWFREFLARGGNKAEQALRVSVKTLGKSKVSELTDEEREKVKAVMQEWESMK